MPESKPVQASITDKLDECLARMVADGETPRAIYLTPGDHAAYAAEETELWRNKLGGDGLIWPLSHADVQLISEKLIDRVEIPVRQRTGVRCLKSTIYSARGVGYPVELP